VTTNEPIITESNEATGNGTPGDVIIQNGKTYHKTRKSHRMIK